MQTVTAGTRQRTALTILPALLAGALLRFWMLKHFFEVTGDSLIYGGIAKNLLESGRYALTVGTGETYPTLIRLPGYPLFLAMCFKLFGMENYASAAWVQIVLDLGACLLLADLARRIAPEKLKRGAACCTLWLAALCPFTAVYVANPLTEGLTFFTIALAMWCAARFEEEPTWRPALGFTFAVTYAALLRPDGALVGVAFAPVLVWALVRGCKQAEVRVTHVAHGGGLRPAGGDAVRSVDLEKLENVPGAGAAGTALCNGSGRADADGVGELGKDVVPGFCFDIPGVLERSGRYVRYFEAADESV